MTPEDQSLNSVRRRARPWRIVTLVGSALLLSTFFMPHVQCSGPPLFGEPFIIPGEVVLETIVQRPQPSADVVKWASWVLYYLVPFFFAGLVFVATLHRWRKPLESQRSRVVLIPALFLIAGAALLVCASDALRVQPGLDPDINLVGLSSPGFLGGALLLIIYGTWMLLKRARCERGLCLSWFGSGLLLWWWLAWTQALGWERVSYGLLLATLTTATLLVSLTVEAAILSNQAAARTLRDLALGRLQRAFENRCRKCDYPLIGLTSRRCPECGEGFDLPPEVPIDAKPELSAG